MTTVNSFRNLSLGATVRASSQQVFCDIANEAVLLSLCDGEYYGLNEVAASIWQLIQQPRTVLEVRDALLAEYEEIQPAECQQAVVSFLAEMIALNLVTVA